METPARATATHTDVRRKCLNPNLAEPPTSGGFGISPKATPKPTRIWWFWMFFDTTTYARPLVLAIMQHRQAGTPVYAVRLLMYNIKFAFSVLLPYLRYPINIHIRFGSYGCRYIDIQMVYLSFTAPARYAKQTAIGWGFPKPPGCGGFGI